MVQVCTCSQSRKESSLPPYYSDMVDSNQILLVSKDIGVVRERGYQVSSDPVRLTKQIMNKIKTQTLVSITLYGGLSSMLLWPLSIIPIITIVAGIMTLIRFTKEEDQTDKGYAILGLTLGIIFLIVRLLS